MNDNDNSSLGRGLESLIPKSSGQPSEPKAADTSPAPAEPVSRLKAEEAPRVFSGDRAASRRQMPEAIFHIEVEKIRPNPTQPRKDFPEEGLRELAASIREFGLLQPIVVRKIEREVPGGTEVEYELISGERRVLAARMLGMELIPAIIRKVDAEREKLELAVIENLQREDLSPIEIARAMARLQDEFRLTQREIAARLGKSREAVANTIRLLDLPSYVQEALEKNEISESHGRLLLALSEPALQEKLFRDLLDKHLTTRELKSRVRAVKPPPRAEKETVLPPELKALQEKLSSELGAPVQIHRHGESGRITINFYSEEELKNIVDRLGSGEE